MTSKPFKTAGVRRGSLTVEVGVAMVLLVVLVSAAARAMVQLDAARRVLERRRLAVYEVANVMERIWANPQSVEPGKQIAWTPSPEAARRLPGAQLGVRVEPAGDAASARRVTVEIGWVDDSGRPVAPVRLVAWLYRAEEPQ